MARVYADDIDKLRIPMPASSNWGDPKGRVDPEVLRAAAWGTDFDPGSRNSITQALTQQQPAAGPTPAQQYLQAIGWGGTEQQYYDSLGGPAAAIAQRNAILGGGAAAPSTTTFAGSSPSSGPVGGFGAAPAQPTQEDYYRNMQQLDWGPNGPPPEYAPFPWSPQPFKDVYSGGASGSAAGTGATGGDTG